MLGNQPGHTLGEPDLPSRQTRQRTERSHVNNRGPVGPRGLTRFEVGGFSAHVAPPIDRRTQPSAWSRTQAMRRIDSSARTVASCRGRDVISDRVNLAT